MGTFIKTIVLLGIAAFIVGGCVHSIKNAPEKKPEPRAEKPPEKETPKPPPPKLVPTPPERPILFQPRFTYQDTTTHQGTGFFVRSPGGKTVAVTSAHFLRRDGDPLLKAEWLDVRTDKPVAVLTSSWGRPGDGGGHGPIKGDMTTDYFLMPVEEDVPVGHVLELDPRPMPEKGERIWFPNKDGSAEHGHRVLSGSVLHALPIATMIQLDQTVTLQSQSGSPILSQTTGKVIGTLARGGPVEGRMLLVLCPSRAILDVLKNETDFISLQKVVGKEAREKPKKETPEP